MKKEPENTTLENVTPEANLEFVNSLGDLSQLLTSAGALGQNGSQVSQTATINWNLRWYFISNNRQTLSQSYVEHGIIQTLVDQPVDDAFRAGFEIKTDQLTPDEIEELEAYCEKERVIEAVVQAAKWARLFGGGAVLLITEQDPATPLDLTRIKDKSRIKYRAVDQWELYQDSNPAQDLTEATLVQEREYYFFYGQKVHHSRVFPISGKQAPSFARPRLRGWGMSEVERLVRSLNQYLKNQDVIFELLDEAKVDVYKIKGFNNALANAQGTRRISERIQHANTIKNFNNALTMDGDDEYEQKSMAFAGLAEILVQIRIGIASDVKMPVTKLFGLSAAGFNSGEDDIENYNSMVESEVRSKTKYIVVDMLQVACQKLFGLVPDDIKITFKPLRVLSAEQEENVKDKKFNRVMSSYQSGLINAEEAKTTINKDSLLPTDIDESADALEPIDVPEDYTVTTTKGE